MRREYLRISFVFNIILLIGVLFSINILLYQNIFVTLQQNKNWLCLRKSTSHRLTHLTN